jgi:MraZ protein
MLLTGTFERSLDEKLRLALPKQLREALAGHKQLLLTPGTDGSLALFAAQAFNAMAAKLAERSPAAQQVRAFSRLLYAQSQSVEIDSQGRIRVAAELARLAQLEGEIVLIGVGDRVELWNKSRWEAYLADLQPQYDALAEGALSEQPAAAHEVAPNGEAYRQPVHPR